MGGGPEVAGSVYHPQQPQQIPFFQLRRSQAGLRPGALSQVPGGVLGGLFLPGAVFLSLLHEKRALEKAGWVAENVCAEVPHRQFVFTIPKRLRIWEQEVFALLLREGRITEEVAQNIRSWKHSGFSVDQSVRLEAGDAQGIQRLIEGSARGPPTAQAKEVG